MAFHNVRLPDDIEKGALGGPGFKTSVGQTFSGFEQRNIDWDTVRGDWDVGYGIKDQSGYQAVLEFFYARQGKAHSFRFKDWIDFTLARQSIGTTDGSTATFQIFKRYTSGGINYDRNLIKPVASGWQAWVNNIAQTVVFDTSPGANEVAVNSLTGIATLGATHAATTGEDIEVAGEFDVPVRFDIDKLDVNIFLVQAGTIPQIQIIEVRGE